MIYSIDEIKNKIKEHENYLKQNFHVRNFFLFGSYARGSQTEKSDIDLLAEFSDDVDFFMLIDLQEYLSELFAKKVDLGTPAGLKSYIKDLILSEAIAL